MNRLRYYDNNFNSDNNLSGEQYLKNLYSRELYPKDFFSTRRIYPTELQQTSDLYSTYFYPTYANTTYANTTYSEPRTYRPGGCCTPDIHYTENVEKRTLVNSPYVKRCANPLFYSQIPNYVIFHGDNTIYYRRATKEQN